jgi:DNA-binding XRE family transcriptional regulator
MTDPLEPMRLATYAELADVLSHVRLLLQSMRRTRQLTMQEVADEIGFSIATVSRIESGKDCSLSNAVSVLRWLDRQTGLASQPRCLEPECPDFGDPDFGEATCPAEHATPRRTPVR